MNNDDVTISLTSSEMEERLNNVAQKADTIPAALLVIDGSLNGTLFNLEKPLISCGRSQDNDIPLLCQGISRKHCTFTKLDDGNFSITDSKSKNGTFVNNIRIQQITDLNKGDIIKLGTLTIKYIPKGDLERLTYDKLYLDANTDKLTSCYNKSHFLDLLEVQVNKSRIDQTPLALLFFDIDFFKKINDSFGHDAGDYVLQQLSQLIRQHGIREENDVFARYGGEEFAISLVNTNRQTALEIAERLRILISQHFFNYEEQKIDVTISIGLAYLDRNIESAIDLLKLADQAMYQSKHNGRNQVTG